jgi:hypothetical protein
VAAVGFVANPHAGKDVRRLVALASPVSDAAKVGTLRRALVGAAEGGADRLLLAEDTHHLTERAADGLGFDERLEVIESPRTGRSLDTVRAATALRDAGADVVVVLGGDGTCRDVVTGWRDVVMVALSTGTNNVFPRALEATTAGLAAARVATGAVCRADAADRVAVLDVGRPDGTTDLALVDLALLDGRFTASRAVWDVSALRTLVCAIAEIDSVGLSAVAAAVADAPRGSGRGIVVHLGPDGRRHRVAVAPGRFADVAIRSAQPLELDGTVVLHGPGVLAFDGERDLVLLSGQSVGVTLSGRGPWVIDVARTLTRSRERLAP